MSEETSTGATPGCHWTTALQCGICKTVVRYVDEVPPWHESEGRRRAWEDAREWVKEHVGESVPLLSMDAGARLFAPWLRTYGNPFAPKIAGAREDVDLRCVDCPACGAELFIEDTIPPTQEGT